MIKKLFLLGLLLSSQVFAKDLSLVEKYAQDYFANKESQTVVARLQKTTLHPHCEELPTCLDASCDQLPSYKCDDISEIQEVTRACRGNYNGDCVRAVCDILPSYRCDDMDEIKSYASACVGNIDGKCVESVCQRLPSYECDDSDELIEVAKTCSATFLGK